MRDVRFSSSLTLIDVHMKHCWSALCALSHSFCEQNIFLELNSIEISREFDLFRNKAKKCGTFSQKCGKEGKMWDFPHDCGMVDTYRNSSLTPEPVSVPFHCRLTSHMMFSPAMTFRKSLKVKTPPLLSSLAVTNISSTSWSVWTEVSSESTISSIDLATVNTCSEDNYCFFKSI